MVVECEACGSIMARADQLERLLGKPPEQPLYQCGHCKHAQVSPVPPGEVIAGYYQATSLAAHGARLNWNGGKTHPPPSYARRLGKVRDLLNGSPRLLDVGYGTGSFLRAAHQAGCEVSGIDSDDQHFHPDFPCRLKTGELVHGMFPSNSFDIVSLHHVLEHVVNLKDILEVVYDLLVAGGFIVVEVPHDAGSVVKRIQRGLLRKHASYFSSHQHLRYFSQRSLALGLERAGFRVIQARALSASSCTSGLTSLAVLPLSPLERWCGMGHFFEAIATKPADSASGTV